MDRLAPLFNRFEDEKNEELFPVCTSQIARLYSAKTAELHISLIQSLTDLLMSSTTYKRLIAAAIIEKILEEIYVSQEKINFFFESSYFDLEKFKEELEDEKKGKSKTKPQSLDVDELMKINIATASYDTLKKLISKKENMLYSKSESKIEKKEKQSRNVREEEEIQLWNDTMAKQENFYWNESKNEKDKKKDKKRVKVDSATENLPTLKSDLSQKIVSPTSLPEIMLKIAFYLVFNSKWEIRHGGLLVFRAVARKIAKLHPVSFLGESAFKTEKKKMEDDSSFTEQVYFPNPEELTKARVFFNEEIKQKSMILLSLDCFSDFLSDKSNMINRGLAAEILIVGFRVHPNLSDFANFFDFLFNQKADHWHSKQALIYFCKQLVENVGKTQLRIVQSAQDHLISREYIMLNDEGKEPILTLPDNFKKSLLGNLARVFREHEEVTELSLELLSSIMVRLPDILNKDYVNKFGSLTCQSLSETPEISFLPFSAFDFFRTLVAHNYLPECVVNNLVAFLKKFLFHENALVRTQIYNFLLEFFEYQNNFKLHIDAKFYFQALLFAFLLQRGDTRVIARLFSTIIKSADRETRDTIFTQLLSLLECQYISAVVELLKLDFHIPVDHHSAIDTFKIIELAMLVFENTDSSLIPFEILPKLLSTNSLALVPLLLSKKQTKEIDREELITASQSGFHVLWLDQKFLKLFVSIKQFFAKHKQDLITIDCPEIKETLQTLLGIFNANPKQNFTEFYNLFVTFSGQLKTAVEENRISVTKAQLRIQLEGELLPELRDICLASSSLFSLFKASISVSLMSDFTQKKEKPQIKLNLLIKPLLDVLEMSKIGSLLAQKFCETLYAFIPCYENAAESPNSKILKTILKRAGLSEEFRLNSSFYLGNIFENFGEQTLERFPEMAEFFSNEEILASLGHLALRSDPRSESYKQTLEMIVIEKTLVFPKAACSLATALFSQLKKAHECKKSQGLSFYLTSLLDQFKARQTAAFEVVKILLEKHAKGFILFSKIFVPETIKIIICPEENSEIFELFVRLLATAGLENTESADGLSEELQTKIEEGTIFLLDFKNSKNFVFDETLMKTCYNSEMGLRPYQLEGIRWLLFLFKYGLSGALCDDMGLGKTLQTLIAVAVLHQIDQHLNPVSLVVVPSNLIYHWEKECTRYINPNVLKPLILTSSQLNGSSSFSALRKGANLIIMSYNTVSRCASLFEEKFDVVVIDEAHLIKNPKSMISQTVKKLSGKVKVALTGTPIQNNILELWSIFDFLMPGYLGQQDRFKREFKPLIELNLLSCEVHKMELSANQKAILDELHLRVLPFIMRREKSEVLKDLPPKIIQDIECDLTSAQLRLYEHLEKAEATDFKVLVEGQNTEANLLNPDTLHEKKETTSFFSFISKLRKCLNHPSFVTESMDKNLLKNLLTPEQIAGLTSYYSSGKFVALNELLTELGFSTEDKAMNSLCKNKLLIFTRCSKTLGFLENFLRDVYPALSFLSLKISQTPFKRAQTTEHFNNVKDTKVLLLTTKIGGLGLNLYSANVVVMFDHDFNPMNDLQAMDRAHRLGQKSIVNVFRLITRGTLEEKIMGIQKFKIAVSETVINTENASIDNVKKANFIGNLEQFASKNVVRKSEGQEEDSAILKILRKVDLPDLWDEDEYDKEFI